MRTYEDKMRINNPISYLMFENSIKLNRISHFYIFSGEEKRYIEDEYLYLIQKIISPIEDRDPKTYADLIILDGTKRTIKKESVYDAITRMQETPLEESGKKFLVIKNIENSSKAALNSLLKFIEEPTNNTYIIGTTNRIESLLSTIISRAQVINLRPISSKTILRRLQEERIEERYASIISKISSTPEEALEFVNSEAFFKVFSDLIIIFKKSLNNSYVIITELSLLITKSNFS